MSAPPPVVDVVIDLDDVFVLYAAARRDVAALRGLSLTIRAGERVVVHGPSGAGKSTFVKLVTAALVPNAGSARLFGHELTALDARARNELRREAIGTITQHSGDDLSPELTCVENIALQPHVQGWSRAASITAAREALAAVGLEGYERRRISGLSHGELQRVGVAAAIAHRPRLIVADEPTGQLDATTADSVFDVLAGVAQMHGATLVIATHDEAAGRLADRVLTIADGRLSYEQRRGELMPSVVIDRRGWLRLPPDDRDEASMGDRVGVSAERGSIRLTGAAAPAPRPDALRPRAATAAGPRIARLVDASFTVGGTVVLPPTSVDVHFGQLYAVTGRSGSGKTTLLSVVAGWLAPTAGTVELDAAITVAACPAVPVFTQDLTVSESLALAARVRHIDPPRAGFVELLRDLDLTDLARRSVTELSGGERQRLAIGRCVVTGASLLLLDEPTAQLDRTNADRVVALLTRAALAGTAIVCATHDPSLCAAADHVVALPSAEPVVLH